jgi:hypothetical protein
MKPHLIVKRLLPVGGLFALSALVHRSEDILLRAGMLNTRDCAGDEPCRLSEYITNVWCWDGAILVLIITGAFLCIVMMVRKGIQPGKKSK